MNRIEEELRTLLRTKVAEAPVRDEPPAFVLRRTRTLRVVNAIGGTAAAAAVVLGVVVGAQSLGDERTTPPLDPGGRTVPWRPLPVEATVNPGDLMPGRDVPCTSEDIVSTVTNDFPGLGFNPRNADVSCSIDPDSPGFQVIIRDAAGPALPVNVRVESAPVIYVKGNDSYIEGFSFAWSNYCGPRPREVTLEVTLPGGGTFGAPFGPNAIPACTQRGVGSELVFESGVVVLPRQDVSGSLMVNLSGSITAPATVARGETLVYRVRLFNPLDQDVALDPCPSFVEALTRTDVSEASEAYRLNCEAVRGGAVPAHRWVDFEMRFRIPAELAAGEWELSWGLTTDGVGVNPARARIRVI